MDSSASVPVVTLWPCVKVNVKGLFVSAQRAGVSERTEGRPECRPVTGTKQHSPITRLILIDMEKMLLKLSQLKACHFHEPK